MTIHGNAGVMPPPARPGSVAAFVERVTPAGDAAERVYLHDSGGRTWRVYDRSFGPPYAPAHRHHTFSAIGDRRATLRWFQGRDGSARLFRFAGSDDGLADVATLEDQLLHAAWRSAPLAPAGPIGARRNRRSTDRDGTI